MRRVLLAVLLVLLAACSSGGSKSSSSTTVDEKGAETALRLQLQQIGDGQYGPLYTSLHPAQQAVLTKDAFIACYEKNAPTGAISGIRIKSHYAEDTAIPGTPDHAPSTAITTSFKIGNQATTATFHEVLVGGSWRWVFKDPATCSQP